MTTATPMMEMSHYPQLMRLLQKLPEPQRKSHLRNLCRTDLFFLLRYALNRPDVHDPWLFARCREVQESPNEHLDLWSREHYKSTIITFAKSIQDVLCSHGENPLPEWKGREATIGIFSFNRGKALDFVQQIMYELETNKFLKELFPDILYDNPKKEAKSWSVMGGIIVKRQGNPKEATIEGWGLIDSMPTGSHFFGRVYDDVITEKFARNPDMIAKTTESWELSLNLGARGGYSRYIGTRYNYNDTYRVLMKRDAAIPRVKAATEDGKPEGQPVFLTREELAKKRREMGSYVFACQMLQDPKADEVAGFHRDHVLFYHEEPSNGWNYYILVDPASEKKKTSDYSVFWVWGLGEDNNYYLADMVRDRLNLKERTSTLFRLHRKWNPLEVGYEKYGQQSDIEHIEDEMGRQNYRFTITPLGGQTHKNDRIRKLIPLFENGRIYLPAVLNYTQYDNSEHDLIEDFMNDELDPFPVGVHDDMLDCAARILDEDLGAFFPKPVERTDRYKSRSRRRSSWVTR